MLTGSDYRITHASVIDYNHDIMGHLYVWGLYDKHLRLGIFPNYQYKYQG